MATVSAVDLSNVRSALANITSVTVAVLLASSVSGTVADATDAVLTRSPVLFGATVPAIVKTITSPESMAPSESCPAPSKATGAPGQVPAPGAAASEQVTVAPVTFAEMTSVTIASGTDRGPALVMVTV